MGRGNGSRRGAVFSVMATESLPPASPEARRQGCTCPEVPPGSRDPLCPLHGLKDNRAAERGAIDADGDAIDRATEQELRRE